MTNPLHKLASDQAKGSARGLLEELFEDYYRHRFRIYKMNFVRGMVFGFGSVIGGTLMIALLLWVLSFFSELPFVGHFTQTIQHSIERSTKSPIK